MFAWLVKGKAALENGEVEQALAMFREGQTLPQSLGAGIWNHCKLVPLKYHEAICLEKLGRIPEAKEIFSYIAGITVDYFSNMHLKELPYWQAKSLEHLGEPTRAQHLVTRYRREWSGIGAVRDNGFFATTPFFISFVDAPETLRAAQHHYFAALGEDAAGNGAAARTQLELSLRTNRDNLHALLFERFGFLS